MSRYVVARLVQGIITLLIASMLIFGLVRLIGNPAAVVLPEDATQAEVDAMTKYLGLDKPLPEQYWLFIIVLTSVTTYFCPSMGPKGACSLT
jgi:peptide/nickel transport system permease protein